MRGFFENLTEGIQFTGDIKSDMMVFLKHHGFAKTVGHSIRVATEARRIAGKFGEDAGAAEVAGWLHDISAVFPAEQRTR